MVEKTICIVAVFKHAYAVHTSYSEALLTAAAQWAALLVLGS
jgi:hypothetical protein